MSMKHEINNVTVLGAGTLGSQIAWQIAWHGFSVVIYNQSEEGLERAKRNHKSFAKLFVKHRGAIDADVNAAQNRLMYTTDLAKAVENADITSESIPEDVDIKKEFYRNLAEVAPEKTIFTTNSSTLLPSQFADETGRPEKFLALHFANEIWLRNVGEVMGHLGTSPAVFDRVVEFAKEIGMVPIPIYKEYNGYVLNALLVPLLIAAIDLLANDVSDHESIDKTWMISTQVATGPCGIMDMIGMNTIYHISKSWDENTGNQAAVDRAAFIEKNFLEKGRLGIQTGEGFYKYPDPKYKDSDFLK